MEAIGPWVQDCIRLMDSDGAYAHFKYSGQLADQPALDMDILDSVRSKWCELRNKDMENKYGKHA
jgi:hypothetical protein